MLGQRGAVVRCHRSLGDHDDLHDGPLQRRSVPGLHGQRETMQRGQAADLQRGRRMGG
jgi:hypothetical protein